MAAELYEISIKAPVSSITGTYYMKLNPMNEDTIKQLKKIVNEDNQGFKIDYSLIHRILPDGMTVDDASLVYYDPSLSVSKIKSADSLSDYFMISNKQKFMSILTECTLNSVYYEWIDKLADGMDPGATKEKYIYLKKLIDGMMHSMDEFTMCK